MMVFSGHGFPKVNARKDLIHTSSLITLSISLLGIVVPIVVCRVYYSSKAYLRFTSIHTMLYYHYNFTTCQRC